ncbi:DUF3375 family protein [Billgrantia endophytica]|uniref:Uncharacterized protein n=1 Tax=Billgrantia endophytica TaxID=2033802 RepID=A0A2N7U7L2_9GAMM|nr:DUF3375 family protein [Halomonas endophytica]PMR76419.1 hypothetical protein C1H69_05055 [Halomonas endophytica]
MDYDFLTTLRRHHPGWRLLAAEKALQWLASLQGQQFIGAESRLLTVFELLREISEGAETDPQARIAELSRRQAAGGVRGFKDHLTGEPAVASKAAW